MSNSAKVLTEIAKFSVEAESSNIHGHMLHVMSELPKEAKQLTFSFADLETALTEASKKWQKGYDEINN